MKRIDIKTLALAPTFTALTIIGAFLRIDIPPVPVTFQLFFCLCAGIFLGRKGGALSQLLYVLLGLMGLPIFSSGFSGIAALLSPTFGYILGFPLAAWLCGWLRECLEKQKDGLPFLRLLLCLAAGLFVDYVLGVAYFYFILNCFQSGISFSGALSAGAGLLFVKDLILCIVLTPVARYIFTSLRHLIKQESR